MKYNKIINWIKVNWDILGNSGSLIGTMFVTSFLGFIFWWLAAKFYSPETVGIATATISSMSLLGTIGILGLGTLLIGELQRRKAEQASMILTSLLIVGISGAILGLLFAAIIPLFLRDFQELDRSIINAFVFSAGVSLTSIGIVLDQSLIGLLRGNLQLRRNTIFSVSKLAALFLASIFLKYLGAFSIYIVWMLGNFLSIFYIATLYLRKSFHLELGLIKLGILRDLRQSALRHHILNLTIQVPSLLLPLIVTATLSSKMNAYFYAAWMIANFVFYGPAALSTVLYAVSAADLSVLTNKMKFTLRLSLVVGILANTVLFISATFVLNLFNPAYAVYAGSCLRLMGFGFYPLIIKNHYIAYCRITDQITKAVYITAIGALSELVFAALGAKIGGLEGLGLGWLFGLALEALIMFPTIYHVVVTPRVKLA